MPWTCEHTQVIMQKDTHPCSQGVQPLPALSSSCRAWNGAGRVPLRQLWQQEPPMHPGLPRQALRKVHPQLQQEAARPRGVCESQRSSGQRCCPGHPQPAGLCNPGCNFLVPESWSSPSTKTELQGQHPGACTHFPLGQCNGSIAHSLAPQHSPWNAAGSLLELSARTNLCHTLTLMQRHWDPTVSRRAQNPSPSSIPSVVSSHQDAHTGENHPSAAASYGRIRGTAAPAPRSEPGSKGGAGHGAHRGSCLGVQC